MQGIKLVTFDATNTLLRMKFPPWKYYRIVAQDHGFVGSDTQLKTQMIESYTKMDQQHPNFGKNDLAWENWWKEVIRLTFHGLLPPHANIDSIAVQLINAFRTDKCWVIAHGSRKLLEFLRNEHKTVGIISNFDPRLEEILRNINYDNYFNFILTSYEVGYSKPDRRLFELAIKTTKKPLEPRECLHIGDDLEKDYKGAKAAGWNALLVNSSHDIKLPVSGCLYRSIEELGTAIIQNNVVL